MKIFDGNKIALDLEKDISRILSTINEMPVLDIVNFGDNPSSRKYINLKKSIGERLGIEVNVYDMGSEPFTVAILNSIVKSDDKSGIIVQLPLPSFIPPSVLNLIPLTRDIDVLSTQASSKFYSGDFNTLSPVIRALDLFIKEGGFSRKVHTVSVIGNGDLVGKPVTFYLKSLGFDVTVITDYIKGTPLNSDLVISCVGIPNLITGDCLIKGSSIVDFGSSVVDGTLVGDLDIYSPLNHLDVVSASPGGMGPLVVRFLFLNLLRLYTGL